jgi:hypothetical protein
MQVGFDRSTFWIQVCIVSRVFEMCVWVIYNDINELYTTTKMSYIQRQKWVIYNDKNELYTTTKMSYIRRQKWVIYDDENELYTKKNLYSFHYCISST